MNRALAEFCASPLEYDLHEMVDDEDMLEMAKDCENIRKDCANNFQIIKQTRRECMELSIQERLKDLRVERGLTLEQLAEETHLSKSALGSYEGDNLKDISHHALIQLAKFYDVTVDYLLGRSKTKNHPTPILQTCA